MSEEIKVIKSTFQALEPYLGDSLGIGIPEQIFVVGDEFELEIHYNPLELDGVTKDEVSLLAKAKNNGGIYRIMIISDNDTKAFKASDVFYRKVYGLKVLEANTSEGWSGAAKMWFKRDMSEIDPEPDPEPPIPPEPEPPEPETPPTPEPPEVIPPYEPPGGVPPDPEIPEGKIPEYKCWRCCRKCYCRRC